MSLLTCTAVGSVFVDVMRYDLLQQAPQHADTQTQTRAHTPTTPHAEAASATYQVSLYDASLGYPSLSTYCNTLQHAATHCDTLRHAAAHCSMVEHSATHCNTLQHTRTHAKQCNTLQQGATHTNTHQHGAPHTEAASATYRLLLYDASLWYPCLSTHCNTLQHTATHCNTLQHTATHCNTLQHTSTRCATRGGGVSNVSAVALWCFIGIPLSSNTPLHTATRCNTLRHTATHCNTNEHAAPHAEAALAIYLLSLCEASLGHPYLSLIHCSALHCNTLERTCNTLQRTHNTLSMHDASS